MKEFVGILILMETPELPRLEMYWSTQELHKYISTPVFLTKSRFEQVFRFLMWPTTLSRQHLQQHQVNYSKKRPLANLYQASFQFKYVPKQAVTIDEAMISFKGHLSFKQYMKDKLTK